MYIRDIYLSIYPSIPRSRSRQTIFLSYMYILEKTKTKGTCDAICHYQAISQQRRGRHGYIQQCAANRYSGVVTAAGAGARFRACVLWDRVGDVAGIPSCPPIYTYIHVYMYVCMYTHTHTHTHIHVCMYIYVYIYTCMYVLHIFIDTCVHVFIHIHIYIYVCVGDVAGIPSCPPI